MAKYRLLVGDCREMLRTLPDESVHCVVTSPPYWGLRDYGLPPTVWGGDPDCDHEWGPQEKGKRKDILPAEQSTAGRLGTHGRAAVLIELNPQYADLIRDRIGPMLEETAVEHHEAPERRLVGAGAV